MKRKHDSKQSKNLKVCLQNLVLVYTLDFFSDFNQNLLQLYVVRNFNFFFFQEKLLQQFKFVFQMALGCNGNFHLLILYKSLSLFTFFCFAHCVLKSDVCTSFDLSVSGWFYWGLRRSSSWWHIFHWWCNFISWRWKCDSLVHSFIWIDQQLPKEKIHQRGFWQNIATIGTRSSSSSLLTRKNSFKQLNQYFPRTLCQTIRKVHCFVLVSS